MKESLFNILNLETDENTQIYSAIKNKPMRYSGIFFRLFKYKKNGFVDGQVEKQRYFQKYFDIKPKTEDKSYSLDKKSFNITKLFSNTLNETENYIKKNSNNFIKDIFNVHKQKLVNLSEMNTNLYSDKQENIFNSNNTNKNLRVENTKNKNTLQNYKNNADNRISQLTNIRKIESPFSYFYKTEKQHFVDNNSIVKNEVFNSKNFRYENLQKNLNKTSKFARNLTKNISESKQQKLNNVHNKPFSNINLTYSPTVNIMGKTINESTETTFLSELKRHKNEIISMLNSIQRREAVKSYD